MGCLSLLDGCRHSLVHYNHRHPHWDAMLQIRLPGLLSLWKGNRIRGRGHLPSRQYPVAGNKRHPAGGGCSAERRNPVLHGYWNPVRAAVLQDCEACADALRGYGPLAVSPLRKNSRACQPPHASLLNYFEKDQLLHRPFKTLISHREPPFR